MYFQGTTTVLSAVAIIQRASKILMKKHLVYRWTHPQTDSLGEKIGFPKMETCWKPQGIVTSVVSPQFPFLGNPYVVSTRFPHLETVNLTIPPRFPALETWGKPHKWFPRVSTTGNNQPDNSTSFPCIGNFGETSQEVSTSFHTSKQSTQIHCMENKWIPTLFFTRFHDVFKTSFSK